MRAGAARGGLVVGIQQVALVDRQAATADAGRQAAAKCLQRLDLPVDLVTPPAREPLPVAARRRASGRQRVECSANPLQRNPCGAPGLDQRDAAQHRALVATLVAARPTCRDQALRLVEAQCRCGDTASPRELSDRQLGCHLT
jgi:hypothetical protein